MRKDFFISYRNTSDGAYMAQEIHKELEKCKYENYYNPQNQDITKAYHKRLKYHVKKCKVFIWILSKDCLITHESINIGHQDWYFAEIIWAHKYHRKVLPIEGKSYKEHRISKKDLTKQFYKAFDSLVKYGEFKEKDKK